MTPGKLYHCIAPITVWPAECQTINGTRRLVQFKNDIRMLIGPTIRKETGEMVLFLRSEAGPNSFYNRPGHPRIQETNYYYWFLLGKEECRTSLLKPSELEPRFKEVV